MIALRRCTIKCIEGPIWLADQYPKEFATVREADEDLSVLWMHGGCDENGKGFTNKCNFELEFADGETYEGRIEVAQGGRVPDIATHVREFAEFYCGERRPAHLERDVYEKYVARFTDEAAQLREFWATYQVAP